jgi:hypothetical protein
LTRRKRKWGKVRSSRRMRKRERNEEEEGEK